VRDSLPRWRRHAVDALGLGSLFPPQPPQPTHTAAD